MFDPSFLTAEFWLVRHGETDWNREFRFQGSRNIPLNATGVQQAEAIARSLAGGSYDAIYSSDLTRAIQTADKISLATGLPIQTDPRLRELDLGSWEGLGFSEVAQKYPAQWHQWETDPAGMNPPPGESIGQLLQRVKDFADDVTSQNPGARLIVVSHGITIAGLVCLAEGLPSSQIYHLIPQNTEIKHLLWQLSARKP